MPEMPHYGILLEFGTVLILALSTVSGESVCLSCDDAVHPRDCTRVVTCGSHSDCYIDAYVTNQGYTRYNLGCRDRQQCANTSTTTGRRRTHSEDLECSQCCTGDLCNSEGCNQQGYAPRHSRGPICYSCPRQQTTGDCQVITACGRDEVCKLKRVLVVFGSTQEVQYETTCEYKQKCDGEVNFYKQPVAVGKKRTSDQFALGDSCLIQCCTDDLCNTGCTDWSTTKQTTTTAVCRDEPSCSLLMSSYDVCDNIPVARQFCARSCALCAHSYSTFPPTTTTQLNTTVSTTAPTTTTTMASTRTTTITSTTTTGTTYLSIKVAPSLPYLNHSGICTQLLHE